MQYETHIRINDTTDSYLRYVTFVLNLPNSYMWRFSVLRVPRHIHKYVVCSTEILLTRVPCRIHISYSHALHVSFIFMSRRVRMKQHTQMQPHNHTNGHVHVHVHAHVHVHVHVHARTHSLSHTLMYTKFTGTSRASTTNIFSLK